jgi:hypothetical protein
MGNLGKQDYTAFTLISFFNKNLIIYILDMLNPSFKGIIWTGFK